MYMLQAVQVKFEVSGPSLALNRGVKFNPDFLFLCSKAFSWIIFSVIFRASNHQLVDKKN